MTQLPPAETYERYFVPAMFEPWATLLMHHAAPRLGERVLDVACGTGIVARQAAVLVGNQGEVVAIDMNPAMLAVARALPAPEGANIQWQQANALALPFPKPSFDVALCQHGLPFFPEPQLAVREMHRVVCTGGRALAIVLQTLERHAVFQALMESVARHLSVPLALVQIPFALCDGDELRELYLNAGFDVVDVLPISTVVQFPEPERFVQLAVASSAAAVPAFAELEPQSKAALLELIRADTEPVIRAHRDANFVSFSMFANLVRATKRA